MPSRLYKILIFFGIVASLVSIPLFSQSYNPEKRLEVDFLDVGQGDAILIKTPFDQNILIDGGPDDSVIEELADNLPWWDKSIDLMILTHPHDDHVNGLIDVLKRYNVEKVVYTGVVHTAPNYIEWLEIIRDKNIPTILINKPQTIEFGENCGLDIIYPRVDLSGKTVSNLNNSSIVSLLDCEDKRFLFTGDAEREIEEELVDFISNPPLPPPERGIELNVDVLKAGHHGSDTSSSEDFLNLVSPDFSIIMVGEDNKFGHPSLRILKRLERINSQVYRTDINGTIKIVNSNGELAVNADF